MNYIVGYKLYCCEYSNNGVVVITIVETSRCVWHLQRHATRPDRVPLTAKTDILPTYLYVCHENVDDVQDGSVKYMVEKLIYIP